MLPTINLALVGAPDAAVTEGGASATLTLNGNNVGSFADLLRVPVPVGDGQNAGNLLPLAGELLPAGGGPANLATADLPLQRATQAELDEAILAAEELSVELWSTENTSPIAIPVDDALPLPVVVTPLPRGLRIPGDASLSPAPIPGFAGEPRDVWQPEVAALIRTTPSADSLATPRSESVTTGLFSSTVIDGGKERSQTSSSMGQNLSPLPALPSFFAGPGAAGSAQMSLAPATAVTPLPGIEVALGDAGWADALGQRVLLMTGQRQTAAEIRLTPAELGPIRVNIALEDGAVNVTFAAQHAPAREAIESALPRLREMFGENGVALGDANVSDHAERRDDAEGRTDWAVEDAAGHSVSREDNADSPASARAVPVGLIDTYV